MPAGLFTAALAGLGDAVAVTELQIAGTGAAPPRTESEKVLREYVGDPADVAAALPGHEVLLVHGAPVTAEVLGSAPLRMVSVAPGSSVTVGGATARGRGMTVPTALPWNATAVAELTVSLA